MTRPYQRISESRKRYILKAAILRDKLTDKAMARKFNTTVDAVQNILRKERQKLQRSTPSVHMADYPCCIQLRHVAAGRGL